MPSVNTLIRLFSYFFQIQLFAFFLFLCIINYNILNFYHSKFLYKSFRSHFFVVFVNCDFVFLQLSASKLQNFNLDKFCTTLYIIRGHQSHGKSIYLSICLSIIITFKQNVDFSLSLSLYKSCIWSVVVKVVAPKKSRIIPKAESSLLCNQGLLNI